MLNEVGPPKLKEFSIQVKPSNDGTETNKPMFNLNLVIENKNANSTDAYSLDVEPATLDTLLEGLHRIQQQLSTSTIGSHVSRQNYDRNKYYEEIRCYEYCKNLLCA